MELTQHYVSFGYRVTITGIRSGDALSTEEMEARTFTYIGVDKQSCMTHASFSMSKKGWDVVNVQVEDLHRCLVAIPAMMELKSIEVCNLD